LFVGGLAWETDIHGLRSAFENFGEIVEAVVVTDRETGRSRGFGFVTFTDPKAAQDAKEAMDGAGLDGRSIRVDFAQERQRGGPGGGGGGGGGGFRGGPRGGGGGGGGGGRGGDRDRGRGGDRGGDRGGRR
jgi:RNA recognition motif-containing protein